MVNKIYLGSIVRHRWKSYWNKRTVFRTILEKGRMCWCWKNKINNYITTVILIFYCIIPTHSCFFTLVLQYWFALIKWIFNNVLGTYHLPIFRKFSHKCVIDFLLCSKSDWLATTCRHREITYSLFSKN